MNFNKLLKKYGILLFLFLLIEQAGSYYLELSVYSSLEDRQQAFEGLKIQSSVRMLLVLLSNIILFIISVFDLKRYKSRFYLVSVVILISKVVGVSLLLVYLLYLNYSNNESNSLEDKPVDL